MCNFNLLNSRKYCWLSNITTFLKDRLGFSSIFENHGVKGNPTNKVNNIVKNMENRYEFQWRNELSRIKSKNQLGGIN